MNPASNRSNKPTNLVVNPRTQQQTHEPKQQNPRTQAENPQTQAAKPMNLDLPNPNPTARIEPRWQRLQAKDLCNGFLLPRAIVSFSSVSLSSSSSSSSLFIYFFYFFGAEQELESLILEFHWKLSLLDSSCYSELESKRLEMLLS